MIHLDSLGSIGIHRDPLRYLKIHWNPLEAIWIHLDPLESIWTHWDQLGFIGIHWDQLQSIWILWDSLGFHSALQPFKHQQQIPIGTGHTCFNLLQLPATVHLIYTMENGSIQLKNSIIQHKLVRKFPVTDLVREHLFTCRKVTDTHFIEQMRTNMSQSGQSPGPGTAVGDEQHVLQALLSKKHYGVGHGSVPCWPLFALNSILHGVSFNPFGSIWTIWIRLDPFGMIGIH